MVYVLRHRAHRARIFALVTVPSVLLLGLVSINSAAFAATVANAITGVTLAPSVVDRGQQVTTSIKWQVPDGTNAGDTFSLTLDPKLNRLPSGFTVKDATGSLIANAVISTTTPAVVTFTMTAYAANHIHVTGTAFIISNFSATSGPQDFTFTTGDGTSYHSEVTVTAGPPNRAHANKFGRWLRTDQGRLNPTDFLQWVLQTQTGPFSSAVLSDTIQSPQAIDCATVVVFSGDATGTNGGFNHGVAYPTAGITCSTGQIRVTLGAAAQGQLFQVAFSVSIPAATGANSPPVNFDNTASASAVTPTGTATYQPAAEMNQSSAGGEGSGTNVTPAISITKDDSAGNPADTAATAVTLPDGSTGLVFTITNTGTDTLSSVVVSDAVVSNGTVTGLSCTFLGGSTGTTWGGPFAVNASFTCTASLTGVHAGDVLHHDIATVTAVGAISDTPVTDHNPYYATRPSVSVGDFVWSDTNANGIQDAGEPGISGVTLTLIGPNGLSVTDTAGNPVGPAVTDATGHYSFDNLPVLTAGQQYTAAIDTTSPALSGRYPTTPGAGTDRGLDSSTGAGSSGLTSGGQRDETLDFGYIQPVTVGDYVWLDTDHNGVQDANETSIAGVTLSLTDVNGKPVTDLNGKTVGTVATDSAGKYKFTDLPPGQYIVTVDETSLPSGYAPTVTGAGDRDTDSSTGRATSLVLASGGQDLSLDFGFYLASQTDTPPTSGTDASTTNNTNTGTDADTTTNSPTLSDTGADVNPALFSGLLLAVAGAALLVIGRRRRPAGRK
jgi:hypothetical protein